MGIKILEPESVPAIIYDRIHLEELLIKQQLLNKELDQPKFSLVIVYRPYGLDDNGIKHYAKKPIYLTIEDYITKAMEEAVQGNTILLQTFATIQQALADIISNSGRHGDTQVY